MSITFDVSHRGFDTETWLKVLKNKNLDNILNKYGAIGVSKLSSATPKDTGLTASMWRYKIVKSMGSIKLEWLNDNIEDGVSIAFIIQNGHGTRNNGYVRGVDYINPALNGVFDNLETAVWKEVTG